MQDIVANFNKRDPKTENDRKAKHFFVPKQEIVEEKYDLSYSRYKEEVFEEIEYEPPNEILEKLENIEQNIQQGINELKEML